MSNQLCKKRFAELGHSNSRLLSSLIEITLKENNYILKRSLDNLLVKEDVGVIGDKMQISSGRHFCGPYLKTVVLQESIQDFTFCPPHFLMYQHFKAMQDMRKVKEMWNVKDKQILGMQGCLVSEDTCLEAIQY